MATIPILYYLSYGHMEQMAHAAAEGARQTGAEADFRRAPDLVPEAVAKKLGFNLDQSAPVVTAAELDSYDAVILGIPTRFGRMSAQMASFLDRVGGLLARGT